MTQQRAETECRKRSTQITTDMSHQSRDYEQGAASKRCKMEDAACIDVSTGNEECDKIVHRIFRFLHQEGFSEEGDWHCTTNARGVHVDSRPDVPAPVKYVRGQGFIKAKPEEVLQMIRDVARRPQWDQMCDYGSVVKTLSPNSDIIYLSYQGKLGVCARDLCLLRAWKVYDDGSCVLVSHSIDCEDVPKVAGKVRAELRDCGYVIKPTPGGCKLSYVIQLDMKGYVPLFFTNLIQTQHPLIISMMRQLLESGESKGAEQAGEGSAGGAVDDAGGAGGASALDGAAASGSRDDTWMDDA